MFRPQFRVALLASLLAASCLSGNLFAQTMGSLDLPPPPTANSAAQPASDELLVVRSIYEPPVEADQAPTIQLAADEDHLPEGGIEPLPQVSAPLEASDGVTPGLKEGIESAANRMVETFGSFGRAST